jgi:hypothetical protein
MITTAKLSPLRTERLHAPSWLRVLFEKPQRTLSCTKEGGYLRW